MIRYTVSNELTRLFCDGLIKFSPGLGEIDMKWSTPQFEEVLLNCEINSYASAQL